MDPQFLILHGLGGSGPDHWQTWLAAQLSRRGCEVRYPVLPQPDTPHLESWLEALNAELSRFDATKPLTVVCHSLAVLLWLHHAQRPQSPPTSVPDRVLFVAPPGPSAIIPEIADFFPPPIDRESLARSARSVRLICTDADPYCPERAALLYGQPLAIDVTLLPPEAAHINTASGFGPWPLIESICLEEPI